MKNFLSLLMTRETSRLVPGKTRFVRRLGTVLMLAIMINGAACLFSAGLVSAMPSPALIRLEQRIKEAIARVRPAVVNITSIGMHWIQGRGGQREAIPYRSIGTGVIVDPRGYVLTNAHVIKHAQRITVDLWRSPPVELNGIIHHQSPFNDLAVIRLPRGGMYPAAQFTGPGGARVGQRVLALGSPYGLAHSVSMGIISGTGRQLFIHGQNYNDLIQTDAAINQGNSGGPLIDLDGEVLGISTAIYAPDGVSAGVGFAIPAERALQYLDSVLPGGQVRQAAAQKAMEKEPIIAGTPPPHGDMGRCSNCHTIKPPPPQVKVATIAFAQPEPYMSLPPVVGDLGPMGHRKVSRHAQHEHDDIWVIQRALAFIFAASVAFNMLGVGGGFVYVPILLLLGVNFHTATATSLFIITLANLSATVVFLRAGLIDFRLAAILEPVTLIGAFLGGLSNDFWSDTLLSALFALVLFAAAFVMYRNKVMLPSLCDSRLFKKNWISSFGGQQYQVNLSLGLPLAFCVGYLGGILGFAGGIIKVPMMVLLFGVPMKVAIATSSLMVTCTSFMGCVGHYISGDFDFTLSLVLAIAGITGAQVGARLSLKTDRATLRRVFAVVLFAIAIWMTGRML